MSKIVSAEYDAAANVLRLVEPVEGLEDHEHVKVTIEQEPVPTAESSWREFAGIMEGERGEEFARVIEEMFPPWNADE
jgi:hypothetical protein